MSICEDCREDCRRRKVCWHCGFYVCGYCWNHIHGCEPDHEKKDCKSLWNFRKFGQEWLNRIRERNRNELFSS